MKKGWEHKTIEFFADIVHGKNQKEVEDPAGQFPIYGSGGTVMGYASRYLCPEFTTILGRKGTIDKPKYIETKLWNVDTAFGLVAKPICNSRYLYYWVKNIDWYQYNSGGVLPSLTQSAVKRVPMSAPSLPEQQQIVDYLDSAFAKIDAIKANAAKDLENAKALFQSVLNDMLEPREGWKKETMSDVVDAGSAISYGIVQPGEHVDDGIPVVRPVDLSTKKISLNANIKRTSLENSNSYKRTILNGTEILMCVRGTTGVVSLIDESLAGCNVTRGIVPLKISDLTLRKFVYYSILAPIASDFIQHNTKGAALKQINIADVKLIPISVPSQEVQKEIVDKLERLGENIDLLESNYARISQECDALKQAILRQTFE